MMNTVLLMLMWSAGLFPGPAKEKPPTVYTLPLPPQPDFSQLDWLMGQWTGKTIAPGPAGDARLSAAYDLDKRVIVLRETVAFPATNTVPAVNEQWMGVLAPNVGGAGFVLRMFSSTGFITRYRATVEKAMVHLYPEGGELPPSGWLFRRTFARTSDTEFRETVQAAPPDKPFFDYYTVQFTRATTLPPAAPATKTPEK